MAAYAAGVRTIIIPADNLKDLVDVDPAVRENVTFIPCKKASEVLANALVSREEGIAVNSIRENTDGDDIPVRINRSVHANVGSQTVGQKK